MSNPDGAPVRSASSAGWRPSRYNLSANIPDDKKGRIAVVNLLRNTCAAYPALELAPLAMLDELPETHPGIVRLAKRGLIVNFDELAAMELCTRAACAGPRRANLTICPTMGCNFDCPYCFEDHVAGTMGPEVQDDVVALADRMIDASGAKLLYVTWYGGEPLLAPDVIEGLSQRLIALSQKRGVDYAANIITNGYLLAEDLTAMLERAHVKSAQVTLDGVGATHDATRHLAHGGPTFERIVENISRPGLPFKVLLRHNVHEDNRSEMEPLRTLMERISAETGNEIHYAAQLVFGNERSEGRTDKVDLVRGPCAADVLLCQGKLPTGLRPIPCGAGNLWEVAVDPQGRLYMCWEVVDKPQFAFGNAHDWNPSDPVYSSRNPDKLTCYINEAAPQHHEECAECVWLPLCAGGCPNSRLLGNGRLCLPYKDKPEEYALARWQAKQKQTRNDEKEKRLEG